MIALRITSALYGNDLLAILGHLRLIAPPAVDHGRLLAACFLLRHRDALLTAVDLHKLVSGDRLSLHQILCDLIHHVTVLFEQLLCLCITALDQRHHFFIHTGSRLVRTVHHSVAV